MLWPDFPTEAVVGVPTAALAAPILVDGEDAPADASNIAIVVESESCAYAAGILSFADAGECAVTVTAETPREYAPVKANLPGQPHRGEFHPCLDGIHRRQRRHLRIGGPGAGSPHHFPGTH